MRETVHSTIVVVDRRVSRDELERLSMAHAGAVRYVADVRRRVIALGGDHLEAERALLDRGSTRGDLWGAVYFPGRGHGCIEFRAPTNLRPSAGTRTTEIEDPRIRQALRELTYELIGEGEELPAPGGS
jgi:hypothetical protein